MLTSNLIKEMKNLIFTFAFICSTAGTGILLTSSDSEKLEKISKDYKTYTLLFKANDSLPNWTVAGCVAPPKSHLKPTDTFYISKAVSEISLHGNKLYKLYVKDFPSYLNTLIKEQPIGQIIVKETWNTTKINSDSLFENHLAVQNMNDQNWYLPTTVSQLFIMYKEKENPQNDKGWIYGIVSLEDKAKEPKVITQGKISNCIRCHSGTKYDRIFGAK
jgi:Cytochrome P460